MLSCLLLLLAERPLLTAALLLCESSLMALETDTYNI